MIWGRREVWNLAFPLLSVKYTKARAGQGSAVSFFEQGFDPLEESLRHSSPKGQSG